MEKILKVQVVDKVATYLTRQGDIICGNNDYKIQFIFDAEAEALPIKIARFTWNGQFQDVAILGGQAAVPFLSRTNELKVGVYFGNTYTSTAATIRCRYSARCEEATPTVENDKYYEELAREHADLAKEHADRAEAAADRAESASGGSPGVTGDYLPIGKEGDDIAYEQERGKWTAYGFYEYISVVETMAGEVSMKMPTLEDDVAYCKDQLTDVDSALAELHAYAQGFVSGGGS